jgi:hypothetical protein
MIAKIIDNELRNKFFTIKNVMNKIFAIALIIHVIATQLSAPEIAI